MNSSIKIVARRLCDELHATNVWLFGSRARGDAHEDSDYDFLAVIPSSAESRYKRAVRARKIVSDIVIAKDIIVLTQAEWNREIKVPASLSSAVMREGILVS